MTKNKPDRDMTVDEAIQTFRRLQWTAAEGWPLGEPEDLAGQSADALAVIDAAVGSRPAGEQRAYARQLLGRIEAKEHTATVAPRKRRAT